MTTDSRARRWLEVARFSPSGANAQPWKVVIDREAEQECQLRIFIDAQYAQNPSIMDVLGIPSLLGIGIFLESLSLVSRHDGYKMTWNVNSSSNFFDVIVWVVFVLDTSTQHQQPGDNNVIERIRQRRTHRGSFSMDEIEKSVQQKLLSGLPKAVVSKWIQRESYDMIFGLSKLEKIRWKNLEFFTSLLHEISFVRSPNEPTQSTRRQIPASTLGVNLFEFQFLRLCKEIPFLRRVASRLFSGFIAKKSWQQGVLNSGGLVFLWLEDHRPESIIELGMAYQAIWLNANEFGLGLQPLSQGLIGLKYWCQPQSSTFSPREENTIRSVTVELQHNAGIDLRKFTIGFRVGYVKENWLESPRVSLNEILATSKGK